MKRMAMAGVLCSALLILGLWVLHPKSSAQVFLPTKVNVVDQLLAYPAPPPPHPDAPPPASESEEAFYDPEKPPPDNAPIQDLLNYWARMSGNATGLYYTPVPSDHVKNRIKAEIERSPKLVQQFLNMFLGDEAGTRFVYDIYRRMPDERSELYLKNSVKSWLVLNSPYFADELEKTARNIADQGEYLKNHDELLALTRYGWDRAAPVVNRLYSDPAQPASRTAAVWALYRHAIDTNSVSDTDRYRNELIAIVEDRNATPAMRDLAFDALVVEREWSGLDDWYLTLLGDETLADLRINGTSYTGLSTIIYRSPPSRFKEKMLELAAGDNKTIRDAAVRNLLVILARDKDENIVKALLPWLTDPDWAKEIGNTGRSSIVQALGSIKMPDAVPGLISIMNEKERLDEDGRPVDADARAVQDAVNSAVAAAEAAAEAAKAAANTPAGAANTAANAASNSVNKATVRINRPDRYPYRFNAVRALANQADGRAAASLRVLLPQVDGYERSMVIAALLYSGGYSVSEQVDALEFKAGIERDQGEKLAAVLKKVTAETGIDLLSVESPDSVDPAIMRRVSEEIDMILRDPENNSRTREMEDPRYELASAVANIETPGRLLVQGVIDRIEALDAKQDPVAFILRALLVKWDDPAAFSMLLRDVRNGKASTDAVVKLLTERKTLFETHSGELSDLSSGVPVSRGLYGCLIEDPLALEKAVKNGGEEATAALACARMVRVPLNVAFISEKINDSDKRVALAAERYLISEDSPEARRMILSKYARQAKILGARNSFPGDAGHEYMMSNLVGLFRSVIPSWNSGGMTATGLSQASANVAAGQQEWRPKDEILSKDVLEDSGLMGMYSYGIYGVRIYADRVTFTVQTDDARYSERELRAEEFAELRDHLRDNEVDLMPPYLACSGYERQCEVRDLVMLGKAGGRRVFAMALELPPFFRELDAIFATMASEPMRLRYTASKDIPGLEVLYANDDLPVLSAWGEGDDIRALTIDRKWIEAFSGNDYIGEYYDDADTAEDEAETDEEKPSKEDLMHTRLQRLYANYGWQSIREGHAVPAEVPAAAAFPPFIDSLGVLPEMQQWRTRYGATEIRADENGLYRIAQGKLNVIKEGPYNHPAISSDGRWLVVNSYREDEGFNLFRIDLATGREYPVNIEGSTYTPYNAIAYMPAVNRFLLARASYEYHPDTFMRESARVIGNVGEGHELFLLLDPNTGEVRPPPGEVRPLAQQKFRPLQSAGAPNKFWAAIPDSKKDETVIGIYDAGIFEFKPVITLPRIKFNSMEMWVDRSSERILFAYRGHLLSVPLSQ
ncbi:MAG: HEAT repeat domain-containing protein [Acidobacteria bacterium]|nr:HEAT repeat domain-containing protein [Acidobacteriota bacterium]